MLNNHNLGGYQDADLAELRSLIELLLGYLVCSQKIRYFSGLDG